jgi:hypothetical protein
MAVIANTRSFPTLAPTTKFRGLDTFAHFDASNLWEVLTSGMTGLHFAAEWTTLITGLGYPINFEVRKYSLWPIVGAGEGP